MIVASQGPAKTHYFRSGSKFDTYHVQKGKSLQHHRLQTLARAIPARERPQSRYHFANNLLSVTANRGKRHKVCRSGVRPLQPV